MDGLTEDHGYQGESSRDPAGSRLVSLKKGDFGVPAPYTLRGAAPPGRPGRPAGQAQSWWASASQPLTKISELLSGTW